MKNKTALLGLLLLILIVSFSYEKDGIFFNRSLTSGRIGNEVIDTNLINNALVSSNYLDNIAKEVAACFPDFLYYSIENVNLLIENLYDNDSDVFHSSIDEEWRAISINPEKRTFDNAQAILALLKLADAVINQTERDFAINIANKIGLGLFTTLGDSDFGGFYNSESDRYKKPGVQGKVIQAFIALYEVTGDPTFRDVAINTFNFIDSSAWNDTRGYYAYITSHTGFPIYENPYAGDPYEPQALRVDHNAIMGNALLDLYRMESHETYLAKAVQIYDIINATCQNTSTNLFYTGVDTRQQIVYPEETDLFINSLVLEFLAQLYNATEDTKYYDDFFPLLNSVLLRFWDNNDGGFIATSSTVDSNLDDKIKYTERQFYGIRALDEAYKLTDNILYYNLVLDTVEILNTNLYDQVNGGYYQVSNPDGTQGGDPSWMRKLTITQALAIDTLANIWLYSKPGALNVLWSPSIPRPQDKVTLLIAAFDVDGLSNVFLNYSINDSPYQILEMVPHPLVEGLFNITLDPPHPDGTTIDFNIIINDTLSNQVIRGDYSFFWRSDRWPPQVELIGFLPGVEIPVNLEFSIIVSAQDVPSQGTVKYIRVHYHRSGGDDKSLLLEQIDAHIWKATFPNGLPTIGTYSYYFESIDNELNPGFGSTNTFQIISLNTSSMNSTTPPSLSTSRITTSIDIVSGLGLIFSTFGLLSNILLVKRLRRVKL